MHTDSDPALAGYREALEPLLRRAGLASKALFQNTTPQFKSDQSPVTEADRQAEDILAEGLARLFPDHGLVGEEGTLTGAGDGPTWHIDPLDGTAAFLEGLAHWGPTVCLVDQGQLVAGAIYEPCLDRFWLAVRGAGAFCDERRLSGPDGHRPRRQQVLYVPSRFHWHPPLDWVGKTRCIGSTALQMAFVASGSAQACLIGGWSLWDVGAGTLLATEAGLSVADPRGAPFDPVSCPGRPFMVGTSAMIAYLSEPGRLTLPGE